jgi:hypothetical protein
VPGGPPRGVRESAPSPRAARLRARRPGATASRPYDPRCAAMPRLAGSTRGPRARPYSAGYHARSRTASRAAAGSDAHGPGSLCPRARRAAPGRQADVTDG